MAECLFMNYMVVGANPVAVTYSGWFGQNYLFLIFEKQKQQALTHLK